MAREADWHRIRGSAGRPSDCFHRSLEPRPRHGVLPMPSSRQSSSQPCTSLASNALNVVWASSTPRTRLLRLDRHDTVTNLSRSAPPTASSQVGAVKE